MVRLQTVRGRRVGGGIAQRSWVETLERRQMLTVTNAGTLPDVGLTTGALPQTLNLSGYFVDSAVPENTVFIQTTLGVIPVQLTPGATPMTVANFLNYAKSGRYDGTFFHRSVDGFVIQTGGYTTAGAQVTLVETDPAVPNEPGQSNVRGTIAMAKIGNDPNSATSQFFFNLGDNSSNLDNQNGGFTAFGHVLGEKGLAVMDAIAAVPRVNAGGAFSDLPVIGFDPSSQDAVRFDQLVYVNSVTLGSGFTVQSDNPSVVQVSVLDQTLTYRAQAGGVARVTVTAQGLDGKAVSQSFTVTVASTEPPPVTDDIPTVKIGSGGAKSMTFKDRDGTVTTIALKGPGSATLTLAGAGLSVKTAAGVATVTGLNVGVGSILLTGASGATVITVTTKGGNGTVDIGGIVSSGAMGTLDGKGVNLVGATIVGGAIKALSVKSAAASSSISAASIGSFTASKNSAADVAVSGKVTTVSVDGALGGTWRIGGVKTLSANSIANATIATTAGGASFGTVTAKSVKGSQFRSAGNIGSFVVTGTMAGSQVFAGVSADGAVAAEDAAKGHGQILSIKVGSGPRGNVFANSAIAAKTIKSATLGNLADVTSPADFYGIEADAIVRMTGFVGGKPFSLKNAATQAQANEQLAKTKVSPKKLKFVIV